MQRERLPSLVVNLLVNPGTNLWAGLRPWKKSLLTYSIATPHIRSTLSPRGSIFMPQWRPPCHSNRRVCDHQLSGRNRSIVYLSLFHEALLFEKPKDWSKHNIDSDSRAAHVQHGCFTPSCHDIKRHLYARIFLLE